MEISSNVAGVQPQSKRNQTFKHAENVVITGAGLYGLNKGTRYLLGQADYGHYFQYGRTSSVLPKGYTKAPKIYELVTKFGEKLFPQGGKVHKFLERMAKGLSSEGANVLPEEVTRLVKKFKGNAAVIATAITLGVALVARAIYKAGKINGK